MKRKRKTDKPKRPVGRPRKMLDEKVIAECAYYGMSVNAIAEYLGVDDCTISRNFSELVAQNRAKRRKDLRRVQTTKAMDGDNTMLIWLGRNELDQSEKIEHRHEIQPSEITITFGD